MQHEQLIQEICQARSEMCTSEAFNSRNSGDERLKTQFVLPVTWRFFPSFYLSGEQCKAKSPQNKASLVKLESNV